MTASATQTAEEDREGERAHQARRHALQGPGRDESDAAARDHHRPAHAPPGAAHDRAKDNTDQLMDMLLAKKRAADRREWLEEKGNLAEVQV